MVGVMEDHTKQPAELGNKRSENPATVHFQECFVNPLLPLENLEKRHVGRCRTTKSIIDQPDVLAQEFPRFVTQLAAVLLYLGEDLNESARLGLKNAWLCDEQLSVRNTNALAQGFGETVQTAHKRARGIGEAVNDQGSEAAYLRGVEVIIAHENFNCLQSSLAFETKCLTHLLLFFEGQLVLVFAR